MAIWDILGISQTTDISAIKSAYAAKAKEFHPEEHPAEFQTLQKAYKQAIKLAKQQGQSHPTVPVSDTFFPSASSAATSSASVITPEQKKITSKDKVPVKAFPQKTEPLSIIFMGNELPPLQPEKSDTPVPASTQQELPPETGFTFEYDEINVSSSMERFSQEFELIAKNPYLQNNIACWTFFLEQPHYQTLFTNADFRLKLADMLCRTSGWTQETLSFFKPYITTELQSHSSLQKRFLALWNKKATSKDPSKDQEYMHKMHMRYMNSSGHGTNLDNPTAIAFYLESYFKYPSVPKAVKEEQKKIKKDTKRRNKRVPLFDNMPAGGWILIIIISIIIRVMIHSDMMDTEPNTNNFYSFEMPPVTISIPTPKVDIPGKLANIPSDQLQEILGVMDTIWTDSSNIRNGSLRTTTGEPVTAYFTSEADSLPIPAVYREIISGNLSNVHGYYTNQGTFFSYSIDKTVYERFSASVKNAKLLSFYLIDINQDGTDELCLRNEYGQIGFIAQDADEISGTSFGWGLDSSRSSHYASLFDDGKENLILLSNGTILHMVLSSSQFNTCLYLYIEEYTENYTKNRIAELSITVTSTTANTKPYTATITNADGTSERQNLTKDEMDAWLDEYILPYLIPTQDWSYMLLS